MRQFPNALAAIGVLYPESLKYAEDTQGELEAANLRWWLHGTRGERISERRIRSGSPRDLADQLRVLPLELEGVDRVVAAAGVVEYGVERAARQISSHALHGYDAQLSAVHFAATSLAMLNPHIQFDRMNLGRQSVVWQPASSATAQIAERTFKSSESETGFGDGGIGRGVRGGGYAETSPRRRAIGVGTAHHGMHGAVLATDTRFD